MATIPRESDLDILIDPTPETTLLDIGAIRHELLQLRCAGRRSDAQGTTRKIPCVRFVRGRAGMSRDQQRLADYLAHIIEAY